MAVRAFRDFRECEELYMANATHWAVLLLSFLTLSGQVTPGAAQKSSIPGHIPARQKSHDSLSKQYFERHFESLHPVPRPQFGGAVAGSKLIEVHRQRAAALRHRIDALSQARPFAGPNPGVLPGLEMRPSLGAGSYPTAVVTGDFNKDGHLDFAESNGGSNDIWIYLGKGDNTFQLPRIVQLKKGLSPIALVTADLRGNGTLDLVTAEFDSSTIGVLLGNGDGSFANEQIYALPQQPGAIAVNDFDHDGKLDVAVALANYNPANPIPRLALLRGNGDGTLAQPVLTYSTSTYWDPGTAYNLDSGDINGDGLPDLLVTEPYLYSTAGYFAANTTAFLNNGDGTFRVGQTLVSQSPMNLPVDGRLADVNSDGCADAVIGDINETVTVALGDCSGNFNSPIRFSMGQPVTAVRLADVNGDGNLDLVAPSIIAQQFDYSYPVGNTVSVALGDGTGNFGVARVYGGNSESYALAVGDFKGNGRPSVITADIDTDTVSVFFNNGAGDFGFPQGLYSGKSMYGGVQPYSDYTFTDLNGDGFPDIFQLGTFSGLYAMSYLNDGSGRFNPPLTSAFGSGVTDSGIGDYKLGDFRNTGHLDVVGVGINVAYSNGSQTIFFQPGNGDGRFGAARQVSATGADGAMATGDFNNDGKLDFVAVGGAQAHTLTPFLGNGDGTFTRGTPVAFADDNGDIARVYSSDFNRDGKTDVLVFATSNGYWTPGSAVWEFLGNGNGTFQPGRELFTGFQPFVMADLNNDGHLDIARYDSMWPDGASETYAPPKFTNYLAQADGTFAQVSSYAPYDGVTPWDLGPYMQFGDPLNSTVAADYSGDGKIDEFAFQNGNGYARSARLLMGHGDGTFTPTYDEFPFSPYVYPLFAHDLNGDGFADTVVFDSGGGTTMVQRGAPAPALQMVLQNPVLQGNQNCGVIFADVASASDRTVNLSSSVAGVILPASVPMPASALYADFCYTLSPGYDKTLAHDINATLDGSTATAYASAAYIPGFSLSLAPANTVAVYPGEPTPPVTITITPQANYSSTVDLSCLGLPPGFTCQFTPSEVVTSPGAPSTVQLVVQTTAGTGPYDPITIVADDGNLIQRRSLTLTIASLSLSGVSFFRSLSPGTVSNDLQAYGIPPYSFQCLGLPSGATCSFSGTQAPYPEGSTIALSVTAAPGVSPGDYPFQAQVESGGLKATVPETLSIFSFALFAPSADQDWASPGGIVYVRFPLQASNLPSSGMAIGCKLDSTDVCSSFAPPNPTGTSITVQISIPSGFATGEHQLTISASVAGSQKSFTFPFMVADFSGSLRSSSVTMERGGKASVTGTLTATTGFSANVNLHCDAGAQIACTFKPSSVSLDSSASQEFAVTLTADWFAMQHPHPNPARSLAGRRILAWSALLPFGLVLRRRKTAWRCMVTLLASVFLASGLVSCGGSGSSSTSGGTKDTSGSNSYSITINASSSQPGVWRQLGTIHVTVNH